MGSAMGVVLGLSMTQTAVRWVLVDGASVDGGPVGCGTVPVDVGALDAVGADRFVADLLGHPALVDAHIHAVGVTWTRAVAIPAHAVMRALGAYGVDDVVPVSESAAVDALACGIADVAELEDIAVLCVAESGDGLVAVVDPGGVRVEPVGARTDVFAFADAVLAVWAADVRRPEAIFVLGCGDLQAIVSALGVASDTPVMSAAEAELALARGAALASTTAGDDVLDAVIPARPQRNSKVLALSSVLGVAVVTLVTSLAVALGLQSGPGDTTSGEIVEAAKQDVPVAAPPKPVEAAPKPPASRVPLAPPPEALPPAPEPVALPEPVVEALPEPAPAAVPEPAPAVVPQEPPAYVPAPEPAYVPPPAPAYVPPPPGVVQQPAGPPGVVQQPGTAPGVVPAAPAVPPEQPRLRDRIIDKIPLINRIGD